MMKTIDAEKFEALELQYGVDFEAWPADLQEAARVFVDSPVGKQFILDRAELDALWGLSDQKIAKDDSAFLDRLIDIPEQHSQAVIVKDFVRQSFLKLLLDIRFLLSPKGLAVQGGVGLAIMLIGVFVGIQGVFDNNDYEGDFDISSEYFASFEGENDWVESDSSWN
jgi:hypothetical protein